MNSVFKCKLTYPISDIPLIFQYWRTLSQLHSPPYTEASGMSLVGPAQLPVLGFRSWKRPFGFLEKIKGKCKFLDSVYARLC